jgi:hypothetical protein
MVIQGNTTTRAAILGVVQLESVKQRFTGTSEYYTY